MHDYSLDSHVRRYVHYGLALAAFAFPKLFASLGGGFAYPLSVGATFGVLYVIFDHWVWRKLESQLHLPNLNGRWKAIGISSHIDTASGERLKFEMECRIKQTFSRIEIFGETDHSTSRSFMAAIESDHAVPILRYAFENTPKNMADNELQRHPGLIELRINDSTHMAGDYFTGKHRLKYGELTLTKI
jgi:hypothetical protein